MHKRDPEREQRWRAVMAAYEQSGQSARGFCHERQLNVHTFYGWRRELRRRDGLEANSEPQRKTRRFVQVEVSRPSWLELCLGEELVLRVPNSVDGPRLTEILVAARKALTC